MRWTVQLLTVSFAGAGRSSAECLSVGPTTPPGTPMDEQVPPPSRRRLGTSTQVVEVADATGVLANLARAYRSSELCDVVFLVRAPAPGGSSTEAAVQRVEAMGAVMAAQSPGLKALIYGDVRAGWFGATSPHGMMCEKAEVVIDLPSVQFSVASSLLPVPGLSKDAARSATSSSERNDNGSSSGPWSAAEFRRLVDFCHTGQVALTPGAPETLALALCSEHFAVVTLTEICCHFITRRLAAWEALLCVFLQSICGIHAFTALEQSVGYQRNAKLSPAECVSNSHVFASCSHEHVVWPTRSFVTSVQIRQYSKTGKHLCFPRHSCVVLCRIQSYR